MIENDMIKARAWDALMNYLSRNDVRVSQKVAVKVVGGIGRLNDLIESDKITIYDKGDKAPNSHWRYSAAEVFSHVRTYNK